MKAKILAIMAIIVAAVIAASIVLLSGGSRVQSQPGGSPQSQQATNPNFFEGTIATKGIPAGSYNGTGVYDHNCLPIGNGISSCDAGIQIAQYGTVDFDYQHDMMMKPCIGPGDSVVVTIYGNGTATVNRLSGNPNYS